MSVFLKRRGPAPVLGKLLSDYAEGDIVKLNESGSPVEFYVAKHDYESGLNGTGRTLLVRKDCYDARAWDTGTDSALKFYNEYNNSDIDVWFNGAYKSILDADVQSAIDETSFYYSPYYDQYTSKNIMVLKRSIFTLSMSEMGGGNGAYGAEGTSISITNLLKIAYLNGSATVWWLRSPSTLLNNGIYIYVQCFNTLGNLNSGNKTNLWGSRPCFTLPGTSLFAPDTNEFLKVT